MTNKSLGNSLAHGLSKRDSRESESRTAKFLSNLDHISRGKKTDTAKFNRVVKAYRSVFHGDILAEYSCGKSKKRRTVFIELEGHLDKGFNLVHGWVLKKPFEINCIQLVWFTPHCVARIYQTFGVRTMKEFGSTYLDIMLSLSRIGELIAITHKTCAMDTSLCTPSFQQTRCRLLRPRRD